MYKLQNKVLQDFLDSLVKELQRYNKNTESMLDIPFLLSSLWQAFRDNPDTYSDLVECLSGLDGYQINIIKLDNDYHGLCKVIVEFYITMDALEDYQYEIEFLYESRYYGYCECILGMKDYREDKKCCGHGCDWLAPAFEMRKIWSVDSHFWKGVQHDYWDFEDEFYQENKELQEKEIQKRKEKEIRELTERIKKDTERLAELSSS